MSHSILQNQNISSHSLYTGNPIVKCSIFFNVSPHVQHYYEMWMSQNSIDCKIIVYSIDLLQKIRYGESSLHL